MNLTQLRAFVAVVDHQSFSGAARSLGLSQPAVTMQLQALESETGVTLLDRRYRRVEPTEAGRSLLPHARAVLAEIEAARNELDHLGDRVTGRLDIAASTTPGDYVLPAMLGPFLAANPEVGVSLLVMDSSSVVGAVAAGRAHLGMTGAKVDSGGKVAFEPLGIDEIVVVAARDAAIAARRDLALADLADQTWVMRRAGSGTRLVTEDALRGAGIDPADLRVAAELGTAEAIVRAVEGGLGIAAVSRWGAEKALALGTVVELAVAGFPVARPFFVVLPTGVATRAAEAFVEHLESAL